MVPGLRPDLATDVCMFDCSKWFESLTESMSIFTESDSLSPLSEIFTSYCNRKLALGLEVIVMGSLLSV